MDTPQKHADQIVHRQGRQCRQQEFAVQQKPICLFQQHVFLEPMKNGPIRCNIPPKASTAATISLANPVARLLSALAVVQRRLA
jgi:hypothetical protein